MRPLDFPAKILIYVVALICFVIAELIAVGSISGNEPAWVDGGFIALVVGMLA